MKTEVVCDELLFGLHLLLKTVHYHYSIYNLLTMECEVAVSYL